MSMSVVSGIILQVHCLDDREDPDPGKEVWSRIDEWLAKHPSGPFDPLVDVTDHLVVHKHPQIYVCGGGYNYFPEEEFAAFVIGLPWERPDRVVLVIQPENGPTMVFRPPHEIESQCVAVGAWPNETRQARPGEPGRLVIGCSGCAREFFEHELIDGRIPTHDTDE